MGVLDEQKINNVLSSQVVGRLACTDGNFPYIVPVTYFFNGDYIYGQTQEGKKLGSLIRKLMQLVLLYKYCCRRSVGVRSRCY